VRIHRVTSRGGDDGSFARYTFHTRSNLPAALNGWTAQLEEFAHKGIARKDTLAVTAIVRAMATIGRNYADARRGSIFLVPDFSGGMPTDVSDIGNVLNPIYESIKRIWKDAANEAVVQGCITAQGDMAAHAMTIAHTSDHRRIAPLAFSPVYYIEVCAKAAIAAGMDDALLAAIEATRKVFAGISAETDTHEAEEKALDVLFAIAATSYPRAGLSALLQVCRNDVARGAARHPRAWIPGYQFTSQHCAHQPRNSKCRWKLQWIRRVSASYKRFRLTRLESRQTYRLCWRRPPAE
jgi:hypothetical protein